MYVLSNLEKAKRSRWKLDLISCLRINIPPILNNALSPVLNSSAIKGTRIKLDVNQEYTERNFITPIRAMTEYGLKLQDLDGLKKTLRRSPISDNPPMTVFLRRDVESK